MATDLGERIRAERERAGMTQPELAALVGVSPRTIGNWERGEADPRNSLTRLEDVLPALRQVEDRPTDSNAVLEAIKRDRNLLPEARSHLLNQYQLLLRIAAADDKATPSPEDATADILSLPRVARKRRTDPRKRQT
jgi:transcriptional regulator with XRE-family HTH domain